MDRRRTTEDQNLRSMQDAAHDAVTDDTIGRSSVVQLLTCAMCGGVFGLAAEKCRVYDPSVIADQMSMENFIMLKVFLAAVTTSMFSFSLLSMIPATSDVFDQARRCFAQCSVDKGIMTSIVGGAVLGAGMTVSGACPGMVFVQVGARITAAVFTLAGCLFGALLYGFLEPLLTNIMKPSQPYLQNFLHETQASPYFTVSLPLAAVVAMMVFALELFLPWQSELQELDLDESTGMYQSSWPPYLSGMIIGLLQIPLVVVLQDTLGGSSGYCTVMSQVLVTRTLRKKLSYLAKFRSGLHNWWQVVFMMCVVFGASISSSSQIPPPGVSTLAGFVGGVLMVFGARLAAGCTSGHGISGMGLLSLHSLVCVPAMFAGGIITSLLIQTS